MFPGAVSIQCVPDVPDLTIHVYPHSYKRTEHILSTRELTTLPPRVWRVAQLAGSAIHKSWFVPITGRSRPVQVANVELLRHFLDSFAAVPLKPGALERWLKETEENYKHRMKSTVCLLMFLKHFNTDTYSLLLGNGQSMVRRPTPQA